MMETSRRVVQCLPGSLARLCAVVTIIEYLLCGGYYSDSAAVRGGRGDRLELDVHLDDAPKGEDGKPRENSTL